MELDSRLAEQITMKGKEMKKYKIEFNDVHDVPDLYIDGVLVDGKSELLYVYKTATEKSRAKSEFKLKRYIEKDVKKGNVEVVTEHYKKI